MENAAKMLSLLMQSDEFMYLFWGVLGAINLGLSSFLLKGKHLDETELIEISPNFKHIISDYTIFSVIAIVIIFLPVGLMWSSLDTWALMNYGRRFYPSLVYLFSAYTISQALFAMSKGVYPMRKVLYFIYDDVKVIRRAASIQIISSVILFLVSVLFFLMMSSRIQ